jgi:hypothetical protein
MIGEFGEEGDFFFPWGRRGLLAWNYGERWNYGGTKVAKIRWIHIHMVLLAKDLCNNNGTTALSKQDS